MRKHLSILLAIVVAVFIGSGVVYGAGDDTCTMSVTVTTSQDVSVTNEFLAFGNVASGSSHVTDTPAIVASNGTGLQDYSLQITDKPSAWSVKEAAGATIYDQFKLLALFTTSSHVELESAGFNDNDIVKESGGLTATGSVYGIDEEAESVKGLNCTLGAYRFLWFKFEAPNGTGVTGAQWITVTVTAQAPS